MIFFEAKHGRIEFDDTVPCALATFNGFMSSAQFREFLNKGFVLMDEKRKDFVKILWLADTRKHVVQSKADLRWVAEEWNARILQIGIHHIAFVVPEDEFGEASIKQYTDNTHKIETQTLEIKMFADVESAKDWFRNLANQR